MVRVIKLKSLRWEGHVESKGEMRTEYRVLVTKSEGKKTLGRPTYRWKNNNKMDLEKSCYDNVSWINMD
jgi:hypothetical protein